MDFTTLSMNSVVIAPTNMHLQIREQMVTQRKGTIGIDIVSLAQFISSYSSKKINSLPLTLLHIQHQLLALQASFHTYQTIVCTPLFLKECYAFVNDLRLWDVNLQDLPQHSAAQKELYRVIAMFEDVDMQADQGRDALSTMQSHRFDHVYIVSAYQTLQDKKIIDQLCQQGAHLLTMKEQVTNKAFYYAVNKRAEVEACAQYILQQDIPVEHMHISLCDKGYQPLVKQVFQRYHIPFTMLQSQRSSLLPNRFLSLLTFCLFPDSEHVLACFDTGLFARKGLHALREYIQLFQHDFFSPFVHVHQLQETGNILDTYTITSLKTLEEEAEMVACELRVMFEQLRHAQTMEERFQKIATYVKATLTKQEDITLYTQILTMLEDLHEEVHDLQDLEFLLPFIEDTLIHETPKILQGCLVHSLTQNVLDRSYHFILGATQTNYPAFATKKGIFDEAYVAQIPQYPSMQLRYQHYLDQLQTLLNLSTHIIISYPLGTYEGKGMECALEIEQFMKKTAQPYPLHTNKLPIHRVDQIDAPTAHALFVNNGIVRGSISSLERYVKCPFSYFLRYGLALKEPMKLGFPDAYAGTLSHLILETLTSTYGKSYAQHAKETIQTILQKEITLLAELFPSTSDALAHVKQRLESSLSQTIIALQEFENHSSFIPSKFEYPFEYNIPIEEGVTLSMRGFIDRIDETGNLACILDYKSSIRTLSEQNVFAAQQLQLLTYAMVIAQESKKEIAGAYYVSLKNETINYPAGSISRRKPVTHIINDAELMENEQKKAHRLNGWTMDAQIDTLDDDGNHIVGIRMNKEGIVKPRKLYDLESISKHFTAMYQSILTRLLHGDIACKPIDGACTYCVYHEICRFNGFYEEKKLLVEEYEDIYRKEESEDA